MKIFGLTGSIATGKSFVAEEFRKRDIKTFSSDYAVSMLLEDKQVISLIGENRELSVSVEDSYIDKYKLSKIVFNNSSVLRALEDILHPLVDQKRREFILENKDAAFVLCEIPLLFEKNYKDIFYKVITTCCNDKTQIERALRRKNIDRERLKFIMKQQMHSNLKARQTDYLVYTDISYQYTRDQLKQVFLKEGIK